jgi:hypothetical protein
MTVKELEVMLHEVPDGLKNNPITVTIECNERIHRPPIVGAQYGFDEETSSLFVTLILPVDFEVANVTS